MQSSKGDGRSNCEGVYQLVCFDLYGTLVDIRTDEEDTAVWKALCNELETRSTHPLRLAGTPMSAGLLHDWFQQACTQEEREAQSRWGQYGEPDLRMVWIRLLRSCGLPANMHAADEIASLFRSQSTTLLKLFPGAITMLDALREAGIVLVLLSNAQACYTIPELNSLDIASHFDHIILSSQEHIRKPSPDIFMRALNTEPVNAKHALMVGNDIRCDIEGATAAAIKSVYFHTAISPDSDLPRCPSAILSCEGADYKALLNLIHCGCSSCDHATGNRHSDATDRKRGTAC